MNLQNNEISTCIKHVYNRYYALLMIPKFHGKCYLLCVCIYVGVYITCSCTHLHISTHTHTRCGIDYIVDWFQLKMKEVGIVGMKKACSLCFGLNFEFCPFFGIILSQLYLLLRISSIYFFD